MLQVRGDHVVPRADETVDGDVQGFGDVGGKDHVVRPGAAQELCQLLPAAVDRPGRRQGPAVGPPGGVAHGGQGLRHRLGHLGRLVQGGGRIVEIDHFHGSFSLLPAAAKGR